MKGLRQGTRMASVDVSYSARSGSIKVHTTNCGLLVRPELYRKCGEVKDFGKAVANTNEGLTFMSCRGK